MGKKIILLLMLFSLFSFCAAADITVDSVYMNEFLKIDANYENSDVDNNALCNVFLLDSTGYTIDRLTDEYLIDNNHLYSVDYLVNEPPLYRDTNYTIKTICQGVERTTTFMVLNKRSPDNFLFGEFFYFLDNREALLYVLIGVVVFIFGSAWVLKQFYR